VIKSKISKFYFYNEWSSKQLKEEDISQEELERLSDDEIPDNLGSMLHDDNKLASFKLAKRINMQMGKMIEAFSCISKNMDVNLKNLQTYIKDLQRQKTDSNHQVKKPKQKKLTAEIEKLIQRVEGIEDEEHAEAEKPDQQRTAELGNM
jgi:hypothetical protein